MIPEDVMYWDFSGRRVYDRLEISQNDITALQDAYPGICIKCTMYNVHCTMYIGHCESVNYGE